MDQDFCETDPMLNAYGTFVVDNNSTFNSKELRSKNEGKSDSGGDDDDDDVHGNKELPFVAFLALVALGMWVPSSDLGGDIGRRKHDPDVDSNMDIDNDKIELRDITETKTTAIQMDVEDTRDIDFIALNFEPAEKKNYRRCWNIFLELGSIFYLATLTLLLAIDGGTYIFNFWGSPSELLYMISYATFTLQVFLGPMYALLRRLSAFVHDHQPSQCPLNRKYLLRRIHALRSSGKNNLLRPFFMLVFISWPLAQAIMRAVTSAIVHHKCHLMYFIFSDITSAWSLVVYGIFWYVMYIERVSLHHDLNRVVRNVQCASLAEDVDAARREIRRVHRDYLILRDLMGIWMAMTMVITSWGLLTRLSWDYAISGQQLQGNSQRQAKLYLDITIWSEKIMLIALPFLALGGINLEYLWQTFYHALERIRSYKQHAFWMAIQLHVTNINQIGSPELKWTLVFALIGPYLTIQSSWSKMDNNQNLDFWNGPFPSNCSVG
ncbi:uncharacterized protein LOC121425658 [Lytechinus variegatus]|uniref:uncharacterized protein LOC121425658 n=1 Tax=Lytechinus variegatus TaxID=7654 RepID=UPI001BB20D80|nr:uncharacterized protein LOC121425658 [Lytechinus variegatus]